LHQRLFLATCLALVPGVLFFLRDLIQPHDRLVQASLQTVLRGGLILFQATLLWILWSPREWLLCQLRRLELALVGIMALFFCSVQWSLFTNSLLFKEATEVPTLELVRLWIDASAVRWFFLIVIYGVVIPNTWQRCLSVTLGISMLPLLITFAGAWTYNYFSSDLWYGLLDLVILLHTGVLVAVFGSYRIQTLQQQAFEAQQLGQYRLKRRIGTGGMGEVYEAEHLLLRRQCAIKIIRPDQMQDPAVLERFEREVQAMAGLAHPNTVEIFDYGRSDDGTFYYVMEYLPGLNLEQMVERYGRLPASRAIYLLRQVCRALREAHGVGLLHRDIKPGNIIACVRGGEYDVVKLLDFGLVQSIEPSVTDSRLTIKGMILGSPPFMSPEQAAGRPNLAPTTDIYSLGGVAYYLLTGQPPFQRETPMEMMMAHAFEPVIPPSKLNSGIPSDLEAVILRCLQKRTSERFASVTDLEAALLSCEASKGWSESQAKQWWKERESELETAEVPLSSEKTLHPTLSIR
jgi:serine/threonine-protein kinase